MHKKLFLCLLLLCSFIFIASASDPPPSYEIQPRDANDQDDFLLAAEPLLDDDENTPLDDDEEDEEATSSLNHIDEDDAKDTVEEIDIWANAGDNDDEESEESEEDLVDDEEEEDDEHDHEDDEEEDDEEDEEDGAIDHDSFDEQDEDLYEQDRVQFGLDPDTTQTEEEEELKWSNEFIPEEDRSLDPPPQQQTTYNDDKKESLLEQGHANAEMETKEQEASLMDLGVEDADNDIPPPEHGSHQDSELEKQPTLVQDWDPSHREPAKKPCHKQSTLVWLGLLACCLVLFYGARVRANSVALDGDGKHAILPLHQNDIKSPLALSPDPSIVIDAHSNHLHPPSGRGHHRKASSLSAHIITPRSRPTSVGHESPWTGEWKEGKEW
ncbi:hypothetical protein K450DRAFT_218330 [Umbelopsis ramanniana AG]|uniref:Uncharacterized protein n=1 Tax=Umbelopsis ramanniana AG TaxID=1314678 RepID=A0AAD5EHU3_UMBRA|nr:uncharacterized protein K450DRAFT_218330 [Umbelopsis ramanniana AG]KAI8584136.1 hypothetical protein K450DRAFT_218330 [Umbelopsis ramanniana AG]